jgi:hypothetical protein
MTLLRCILECSKAQRTILVCADTGSKFLTLCLDNGDVVQATIVDDLALALGQAGGYLLEGLGVDQVAQWFEEAKPIKSIKSRVESRPDRSAVLSFEAHDKLLFRKNYDELIDAHMMQDAFRAALAGWHLVRPARKAIVAAEELLSRQGDSYAARLLRILPANPENRGNLLLEVRMGETPVLARFGSFNQALALGNALTQPGKNVVYRQREDVQLFGPSLRLEVMPPRLGGPPTAARPLFEYNKLNVRTCVLPPHAGSAGYRVELQVDSSFHQLIEGEGDRYETPLSLPRAIHEAQDLLSALQGWQAPKVPAT